MTVTAYFSHDGTVGTDATAANTGYAVYSGANIPQFVAGGLSNQAIRFLESWAATGFFRTDSTDTYSQIGFEFPTLPSGNCVFLSVFDATGVTTIARVVATSDGRIRILNGAATADETAASTISAATKYFVDWHVVSGSQELRLYNASTFALLDTLTGAAVASTPGRYAVGLAHNGQRAGSPDLDEFRIGNGWIGTIVAPPAATATATAPTPSVSSSVQVSPPAPATATAAAPAPVVSVPATVVAPTATATATDVTPVIEGGVTLTGDGPAMAAAGAGFPSVAAGAEIFAIAASATASGGTPVPDHGDPIYTFSPPTHEEPMRTTTRPLNYYRLTWANSIVRVSGTFVSLRTPAPEQLTGTEGRDWFRGGYVYQVSAETAAELAAAGFMG